jgi:prepilin-type N-terminal cleavage/methylation domain-containing protein
MDNKGVTLIELLVALAIFSIATVFLAYTITATIRHNFRNSLRDMATTVLNNKINEIKSMDYDDEKLDNSTKCDNPDDPDDPFYQYVYKYGKNESDNITYTICYEIEEVNIEGEDNNIFSFSNKFKRIEITIEWFKPYAVNEKDNITAVFYKSQEYY